jgi:hypothetical protein
MIYQVYQYDKNIVCSCGGGCCVQYKFYGYNDSEPIGGDNTVCPNADGSCQSLPPASCCGAVLRGYIYSDDFNERCLNSGNPKMTLYAGSVIDNYGSIGIASTDIECPSVTTFNEDTTMDAEIKGKKLRVPITIYNDASCGPYGCVSVRVKWFFQT